MLTSIHSNSSAPVPCQANTSCNPFLNNTRPSYTQVILQCTQALLQLHLHLITIHYSSATALPVPVPTQQHHCIISCINESNPYPMNLISNQQQRHKFISAPALPSKHQSTSSISLLLVAATCLCGLLMLRVLSIHLWKSINCNSVLVSSLINHPQIKTNPI